MGEDTSKEQAMTREIILVDQITSAGHSLGTTDLGSYVLNTCAFTVLSKRMRSMLKENKLQKRIVES